MREIPQKVLTFPKRCDIMYKRCRKSGRNFAGMAELADARDLKSREIYFSYRFDPGFRHHYIAEWSSLAARRAHNPKVMRFKSHLRYQKRKQSNGLLFRFWNDVFRTRNVMRTACMMTASPCGVRFAREQGTHHITLRHRRNTSL